MWIESANGTPPPVEVKVVVFDIPPPVPELTKRIAQMTEENIEPAAMLWLQGLAKIVLSFLQKRIS